MARKRSGATRGVRGVRRAAAEAVLDGRPVVYIHGIGKQALHDPLKREWDLALFGREMGAQTRMARWSDLNHPDPAADIRTRFETRAAVARPDDDLRGAVPKQAQREALRFASRIYEELGAGAPTGGARGPGARALPLPRFLRKPITRGFLSLFVRDAAAYFYDARKRRQAQQRLITVLDIEPKPALLIAHSLGSVIAYETLRNRAAAGSERLDLITIGSPLGIREIQDQLGDNELPVPDGIRRWDNFADPLDPVALDKGFSNDFSPDGFVRDEVIVNTRTTRIFGFNPHSAAGYLAHPKVRVIASEAARVDRNARFLVARDVASDLSGEGRQPVLLEVLEPGYWAIGEDPRRTPAIEKELGIRGTTLDERIARAAALVEGIVVAQATSRVPRARAAKAAQEAREAARIDSLRRFVAARLTREELLEVSGRHAEIRVYAVWKSVRKRKLLHRSAAAVQVDAARESYRALGRDISWAVLDTGVRADHPHFRDAGTLVQVWDCTQQGPPRVIPQDRDLDGHGTHVAGIIAGSGSDGRGQYSGMAPLARLHVYKVLDDDGAGEDAWIIKALDHIASINDNASGLQIHGLNLSLGGPYDATVYGCGFSPICVELRRLWRAGVLTVVSAGNEGMLEVNTPDGELEINHPMSIGDPANLEDCIAVGSVNPDKPHLYGVSAFSSRGPTSDGRIKPDVVAPGERILSCNARYRGSTNLYRADSGTSMAAPHVSGLLAAFLSVRREFIGRPDEVKALLLKSCTDLGRGREHQGHGMPNLMRMLMSV